MSIHYFFGTAAAPFTRAHQKIVEDILAESPLNVVYVAITDHDYKEIVMPFRLRQGIVEANLADYIMKGRVRLLRQNERTYKFLSSLHDWMDYIVVGEDEWKDLKAGRWHHSIELLHCWEWKVVPRLENAISSTKVRELLKAGASYEELKDYITEKTYSILQQ